MAAKKNNMGVKNRLMKKNLTQLKAQAKRLKLKGFSTKKKNDLVNSIMMAEARNKKSKTPMRGSKSVKRVNKKRGAKPNLPMRTPVQMRGRRNRGMSDYNGWTNYETWLMNTYFDDYFMNLVGDEFGYDTNLYSQVYEIAEALQISVDQMADEIIPNDSYWLQDLVGKGLEEVNWRELAEITIDNLIEL